MMCGLLTAKLRTLGLKRFVLAGVTVVTNLILQKIYRFDPWHVGGNYYSRPYKARVIALAGDVRPQTVVEIGVGLGDIIGRVTAENRVGLDLDDKVLKAARYLVPRNVNLVPANFLDADSIIAALSSAHVKTIDCLILVNWIHMIEIGDIEAVLQRVAQTIPIHYVVFDTIKAGIPGYRHHHSVTDFVRLGKVIEIHEGDEVRDLVLIEMTAQP